MFAQIVTKQIQARPFRESAFAECQLIRHAAKMLKGDVSERDIRSTIDFLEQMLHHTSEVGFRFSQSIHIEWCWLQKH